MRPEEYEVLVVGAGPAGSHAARRLAESGHDVALVEESEGPRCDIVCTGIVGTEACERLDLPLAPVRAEIGRARFFSPAGHEVTYEPDRPFARVVDRTLFDAALAERAEREGAVLLRGHAVRGVEKKEAGLTLRARTGEGERKLRGRALVVATGHQRWLHGPAGLGTPENYVHGVHLDVPFRDLDAAELYFGNRIAPGFFAWAVPFGNGEARLGVLAPQKGRKLFGRFVHTAPIRERLAEVPAGGPEAFVRRLNSRGIVQGPVRPSFSDRVIAVGEAAGQVKTTTAGGIYYGMIGAELGAEVLSDGLREGRLGAERLARYEEAWVDRLGTEIEAGLELQRVGAELDDEEIDRVFRALQNGLASTVREVVRFDWHRSALKALFQRRSLWRKLVPGSSVASPTG